MPNWCSNKLNLTGDKENVDALLSLIESYELSFDFEKVIPHPEGIKQDSEDGYNFRVNNWGTKWRLEEDSTSIDRESDESVCLRFDTAWSPCLPIVTKLAELFPALRFEYTYGESEMDFSGFTTFENGVLIDSGEGEYEEYKFEGEKDEYVGNDDKEVASQDKESSVEVVDTVGDEIGAQWCTQMDEYGMRTVTSYLGHYTDIEIPEGTNRIGYACFQDCQDLKSIKIPKSVVEITPFSFNNCSALITIVIPERVRDVRTSTFEGCTSLKSIVIPDSVEEIEDDAFGNCTSLNSLSIPESVKCIGGRAFKDCVNLVSVNIPSRTTLSGQGQFYGCTSLTSVELNDGIEAISAEMFRGCTALTEIKIPGSIKNIYHEAFKDCTNLVIRAPKDSYAIQYAKEQGIHYKEE